MLNIGRKDEYGRQKRIEHRGKYLRASRTGGVSLRAQTKAAGLNVTGNTKHGVRVSTRIARGTNVAMQNGRFILRGRYGRGRTKLNVSKSGASVSTRNALGTFNWTNPNRSSAKLFGVQMRGKKAANVQLIYLVGMLLVGVVKVAFVVVVFAVKGVALLVTAAGRALAAAGGGIRELAGRSRALARARAGERLLEGTESDARLRKAERLREALRAVVRAWGAGMTIAELNEALGKSDGVRADLARLDDLIEPGRPRREAGQMLRITAALSRRYAWLATAEEIAETLLLLDDEARANGPRTVLQEKLIDVYSACARPRFGVERP